MRRCLIPVSCFMLLIVAACNLQPIQAPAPTPYPTPLPVNADGTQVIYVTATPFTAPPSSNVTVGVNVDTGGGIPAQSNDIANWIVNGFVIPIWELTGRQGGVLAQIIFCVFPVIAAMLIIGRYFYSGRRR